MNAQDARCLQRHLHQAIDELEKIALNFHTAGRGIERILAINLSPARDIVDGEMESGHDD